MLMLFTGVSLGLLLLKMFYIFCMQIKRRICICKTNAWFCSQFETLHVIKSTASFKHLLMYVSVAHIISKTKWIIQDSKFLFQLFQTWVIPQPCLILFFLESFLVVSLRRAEATLWWFVQVNQPRDLLVKKKDDCTKLWSLRDKKAHFFTDVKVNKSCKTNADIDKKKLHMYIKEIKRCNMSRKSHKQIKYQTCTQVERQSITCMVCSLCLFLCSEASFIHVNHMCC